MARGECTEMDRGMFYFFSGECTEMDLFIEFFFSGECTLMYRPIKVFFSDIVKVFRTAKFFKMDLGVLILANLFGF